MLPSARRRVGAAPIAVVAPAATESADTVLPGSTGSPFAMAGGHVVHGASPNADPEERTQ